MIISKGFFDIAEPELQKGSSEKCGNQNSHNMLSEKSNSSKYLNNNITHNFNWSDICNAPITKLTGKILEVDFIALLKPTLMIRLGRFAVSL